MIGNFFTFLSFSLWLSTVYLFTFLKDDYITKFPCPENNFPLVKTGSFARSINMNSLYTASIRFIFIIIIVNYIKLIPLNSSLFINIERAHFNSMLFHLLLLKRIYYNKAAFRLLYTNKYNIYIYNICTS